MTTLSPDQRAEEKKLILDGAWPHFPVLPVKRDADQDDMGLVAWRYVPPGGSEERPVTVYLTNLFTLKGHPVSIGEQLKAVRTITYPNLGAFFDDGWRGD